METKQLIPLDLPREYIAKDLPYHSDSSNDSAITCEFDEDALQGELAKQRNGYFDDRLGSTSDFKELVFNFTILGLENPNILNNYRLSEIIELIRQYYKPAIDFDTKTHKYLIIDRFGFIFKDMNEKEAFLQQVLVEILNSKSEKAWTYGNCENLKTLVREYGIPHELRPKIWLSVIKNKVSNNYNIENLLALAEETIQMFEFGVDEMNIRQIDLDICRTMPNHQMFNEKANGLDKLKKILVAYSIHVNPNIGYFQAMNFLAALLLIIFNGNENHALMGLICIIDYCFPANYFDENLTGARADQMLLRDLILKKLTSRIQFQDDEDLKRKMKKYSSKIDEITGSLSLNWFLSLFHNAVPWQTRLYILDCFWLEGMKVLFRFGLALLPLENKLPYLDAKEGDDRIGDLINQMKEECTRCHDVELLRKIAFRQLAIPGRRELRVKRSIYLQRIQESLLAAKHKEEKLNESLSKKSEEIDLTNLDRADGENEDNKIIKENVCKKNFKRSNSAISTSLQPQPANRLDWLKKRLSLANFYPISMQDKSAAQKNAYKGLNGFRSCEAISRNGEKLVQMISGVEHHQSRVHIQLRDTHYSHIFYPNRRSSIVLTDSEQHENAILTLRNLYNKDLLLVGVADDGKWIVLLDQMTRKFHSGWLKDSNINVLILSVPFAVRGWYFDELAWQVICLDKESRLWRCDLADPSRSSLCTDFLQKQVGIEPKSNHLNMMAYDDKYCLLWVHMVTKISPKDQTEEVLKRNSVSERMTLSLEFSSVEDLTLEEDSNDGSQQDMSEKKEDSVFFKNSMEDLKDDEDDDEDDDQNDLCGCSAEMSACDHLNNKQLNQCFNGDTFRQKYLENSECVSNCTERCVTTVQNYSASEPIANKLLSRRVTLSEIFRRNSLIILDSNPTDHSNLTDYLISKHGHANLSHTAKDQLKEQKEFQCTVRFALENRIRMHKLFETKHHQPHCNNPIPLTLQTQHSQQQSKQPRTRKHIYHQENHHKNDDLTKIDTNENLTKQQLFVFDTCSMELFGVLKLDPLDGQLLKIFCLSGVAYCAFVDGSIVAITVTLSGNNEQPTDRRQLLQPQPEDELVDLRVFSANDAVRMDTFIQQTLTSHSRTESMSSKESINSANRKSKTNSSSIDEEEDEDEELVHFDAILMSNSRKNSKVNSTGVNNSLINSISKLDSPIPQSIDSSESNSMSCSNAHSNPNSAFNSMNSSKENLKKTCSNTSSEYLYDSRSSVRKFEIQSTDGMNGSVDLNRSDQKVDCLSSPTRCSRKNYNLPSLATIFNISMNSAFLVLALFKSGKLHCIHLKNGCVQERKLFKLDGKLKAELSIENLRIVNAFRMNWSEEEQESMNNLNELIADNVRQSSENGLSNESIGKKDHNNNEKDGKKSNDNKEVLINRETNDQVIKNNKNLIKETIEKENEQTDQVFDEQLSNADQMDGVELNFSRSIDELEQSKHESRKRTSINANQCNYLATLWSPHPINRLVNIKL